MCGIAGGLWTDAGHALAVDDLRRMTAVLAHRGPDDDGQYISDVYHQPPYPLTPGVALGFRRLSVIDVVGSRQPLDNEDGSIQLVFNGEIYNYLDLRRRLQGSGHQFATQGDGEAIVHLYEDEGLGFLDHLVGMFALALWDAPKRRLVLARDRLGQKPLVYRREANRLLFASELKALLAAPNVPREIDPNALDEYLTYHYVPHPHTIYRGIAKLPPGHVAVCCDGDFTVKPYWRPDFRVESAPAAQLHAQQLRDALSESVRARMTSDVPLGAFLSGGVDSSVVVALAQQHSPQPLQTFCMGFDEAEYDERPFARAVAQHLGTDHHEFNVQARCVDILPKLVWHYDEPFSDDSAIVMYLLAEQTRQHVTVVLSGDGGDELFAGYRRYQAVRWGALLDRLPSAVRSMMASRLWQRIPSSGKQHSRVRQVKRFLQALSLTPQRRYAEWVCLFNESRRAEIYSEPFIEQLSPHDPLEFLLNKYALAPGRDIVSATGIVDLLTYLPCDLCHKVDTATMAHSLECRQPLLDHRVVELAVRLPLAEKLRGGRGKLIVQNAFGSLLPKEVFVRKKRGFGVPLDHWFRHELRDMVHDELMSPRALGRGYFRREAVEGLIQQHQRGEFNHSHRLWGLLMLEMWHREWVDGNG